MVTEKIADTGANPPGGTAGHPAGLDRSRGYPCLRVDSRWPLAELTGMLNRFCDAAQESSEPVAVLSLGTTAPEHRAWPMGAVTRDVNRWERAVHRLERFSCVSIAVASGTCGGPALDLLLACDYRIATEDTRLLLPVNDGQFWPGMAMYRLTQQIGQARARQIVLWGHEITLSQALDLGLVDETAASARDAVDAAAVLLGRVAGPDLAVRRALVTEAQQAGFDEALGVHLAACDRELRRLGVVGGA